MFRKDHAPVQSSSVVSLAGRRLFGLAVSAVIVGAVIAACRPNGDVGYVEIKTVPAAPITLTALYIELRETCAHQKGKRDPAAADRHAQAARRRHCRRAGAVVRDRRGAQSDHHGDGVGPGTPAALPMPQQRHRRRARLCELNVIPDCREASFRSGRRPSPESIITNDAEDSPCQFRLDLWLWIPGPRLRRVPE